MKNCKTCKAAGKHDPDKINRQNKIPVKDIQCLLLTNDFKVAIINIFRELKNLLKN